MRSRGALIVRWYLFVSIQRSILPLWCAVAGPRNVRPTGPPRHVWKGGFPKQIKFFDAHLDGLGAHPRVIRVPLLPRGRGSVAPGQREGRRPGLSAQGPPLRKPKNNQPRDPGRPKTHTHVTHTEQEGNRKGAKPSMPRQGSFHSLPHTQIHYTYYYRFESCGGPRSLFLYICLLQLLFSITASFARREGRRGDVACQY